MKISNLILLLTIVATGTLQAQTQETSISVEKAVQTINVLPLSYAYEGRIKDNSTYYLSAGFGTNITADVTDDAFDLDVVITPKLKAQYRKYYNLDKRAAQGKRTASNSGNYWGGLLKAEYSAARANSNEVDEYGVMIAPMWGLQRNTAGRFSFNLNLGYGARITQEKVSLQPVFDMSLGFVISSK